MNTKGDNRVVEQLLTVEEVADWLRYTPGTIRQKVKLREIPFTRVGGRTRFRRADIEAWLEAQRVEPAEKGA